MNALAKLENATRMLAECRTPQDAKKVADLASAAELYARRAKLGEEAEKYAKQIKVDALTTMGELLAQAPKATGTKGQLVGAGIIGHSQMESPIEPAPTLASMGITLKESQESQALARARKEAPEIHQAARNGEVSPRHVAEVMAQSRPMTEEEIEERDRPPPGFTAAGTIQRRIREIVPARAGLVANAPAVGVVPSEVVR